MPRPGKHIALVYNPAAENEKALRIADRIATLLTRMGIGHSVFTTYWPVAWNNCTEVWIIGGDGTLNWLINQYPDIPLPLSIFPGGSGNDFHWMLYGDVDVEKQVEQLLEAKPVPVDAGRCNGKLFLNGVGIGFDGAIVNDLLGKKKLAGKGSYLLSVLKHIAGYREKYCTLHLPDEIVAQSCFMISVANGKRYGGGFQVTPKASVADGVLDVNVVGSISPLKRLRYLPMIEKGEHLQLPFVRYHQVRKITIVAAIDMHAHADGEYFTASRFEIEVLPKRFAFLL